MTKKYGENEIYIEKTSHQVNAKKKNIFISIIIGLLLSSVIILNTYQKSWEYHLKKYIYDDIAFKSLIIDKGNNKTYSEAKEIAEKINHVVNVSYTYTYQTGITNSKFKNNFFDGIIWIYNSNNSSLPKIILGKNFPDNNNYYMVCPNNFYPTSNINDIKFYSKYKNVNMKAYLNKEIPFYYYGNLYYTNNSKDYIFNINIKLIGLYENSKYNSDENVCYVNEKTMKDISNNMYKDDINSETNQNNITIQEGLIIQVDSSENMNMVKAELENMNFKYDYIAYIDSDSFNSLNNYINYFCGLIMILIFIIIFMMPVKNFVLKNKNHKIIISKNKRKFFSIGKTLLLLINCFLFNLLIISITICLIYILFNLFLYLFPYIFFKYKIIYEFKAFIFFIKVFFIVVTITSLLNIFKYLKT